MKTSFQIFKDFFSFVGWLAPAYGIDEVNSNVIPNGIDEINYETRYIVYHRPRFLLLPAEATGTCGDSMGSDY